MPPFPVTGSPAMPPQGGALGAGMPGPQGVMAGGPGGYEDPGGQQAVWNEFPGTDPQVLQQLVGQAQGAGPQGLAGLIEPLTALFAQDQAKLDAMHQEQLHAIIQELMRPSDEMAMAGGGPPPAVGGDGQGF